jgi:hypothetical protein
LLLSQRTTFLFFGVENAEDSDIRVRTHQYTKDFDSDFGHRQSASKTKDVYEGKLINLVRIFPKTKFQ